MKTAPRLWMLRTVFRTVGSVAPGVAARWAETIFCRPPRHAPKPSEEAFLATGERSSIHNEGEELAIWTWGAGPIVVLAHGWGSRAGRFSGMAGALIEAGFSVVLFDAPAHGASTGQQASLPQFARALRAVGAAVGQIYGLVGHSLGGAAISLALHQGLRAERVVLLAPPADVFLFTRAFSEHLRVPHRARQVMQHNLETRLRITWKELHIPTLARTMSAAALVIHDADDPDVPFSHGQEIANAWPGAMLVRTAGLGHRGLVRNPEVIRRIVHFLQGGGGR